MLKGTVAAKLVFVRDKRKKDWLALLSTDINLPDDENGKQRWESVGSFEGLDAHSATDAETAMSKRRVQKREKRILEMLPESNQTFSELTEWYLSLEKVKSLAYYSVLSINLNNFNSVFGDYVVGSIKPVDLENYQAKRLKQGYSESYIDQEIGAAKSVINKAFDNDLIGGNTLKAFRKVKKLLKKGSNRRNRVLNHGEYSKLYSALWQAGAGSRREA